jgi:cell division initiation protein
VTLAGWPSGLPGESAAGPRTGAGPRRGFEGTQGRGHEKVEISPLDVRSQVFKKKFQGCDPEEVKQFLEAIADRMEKMLKAKEEVDRENAALRDMVGAYSKMEQTLKDTLLTAQKVSADARAAAEQTAQNVLKDAEVEAARRLAVASGQVDTLARNRDVLKMETLAFAAKIKSLIDAQARFIESMEVEVSERQSSQAYQLPQAHQLPAGQSAQPAGQSAQPAGQSAQPAGSSE